MSGNEVTLCWLSQIPFQNYLWIWVLSVLKKRGPVLGELRTYSWDMRRFPGISSSRCARQGWDRTIGVIQTMNERRDSGGSSWGYRASVQVRRWRAATIWLAEEGNENEAALNCEMTINTSSSLYMSLQKPFPELICCISGWRGDFYQPRCFWVCQWRLRFL